ncbi:hypothetical protein RD792_004530 [Penstemon davidsonii]|uniref:SBP-type domain-containing protein n=1 Tax=Penstemon davidsonii TaxID=160366 RepID=A0ABR0DHT2_9LAMI|nr:hypothetical protein RD792_004530 [Penstemon davidsonii]
MESSSFPGSSKRAKAPGNITQVAHCLVDGCNADLSLCRDYHRRHKVCETHSKTSKVTINGREQRFCQQCSRFHSLVEFDEGKRSCRKRLDGHNRRRRKPQLDSSSSSSSISRPIFSTQANNISGGPRLLSFSSPQILPSSIVGSSWGGSIKAENEMSLYNNMNYIDEYKYKGVNNNHQVVYNSDGLNQEVVDSDGALSLLSSAPVVTREFGLNQQQMGQQMHAGLGHHDNLNYNNSMSGGLGQYQQAFVGEESKPVVVSATDSDASTLHFADMLHHGHDGSSTSTGSHQTLTFMWE